MLLFSVIQLTDDSLFRTIVDTKEQQIRWLVGVVDEKENLKIFKKRRWSFFN